MTQTVNLTVPRSKIDEMNGLLELEEVEGSIRHKTLFSITADFGDGYQADVEVCTGGNNAFINAVLFLNGQEVDINEDFAEQLEGEYEFSHGERAFNVNIKPED